jgi:YD repeat-containing protein
MGDSAKPENVSDKTEKKKKSADEVAGSSKESQDGMNSYVHHVSKKRKLNAQQNKSVHDEIKPKDQFTITGLEGKSGKGAASTEKADGKEAGKKLRYGYDDGKPPKLNSIERADGTIWTRKSQSDEWILNGSKPLLTWRGEVTVQADNQSLVYREAGSTAVTTEHQDGKKVLAKSDGSTETTLPDRTRIITKGEETLTEKPDGTRIIERGKEKTTYGKGGLPVVSAIDGLVVKTVNKNAGGAGETYEYKYDRTTQPPALTYIKHPDGSVYTRTPPGDEWSSTGKDGTEKRWRGVVSVDQSTGAVAWEDYQSGEKNIKNVDGSKVERRGKDAPTIATDGNGNIIRYENTEKDGRLAEYTYDSSGRMTEAKRPDGTTWKLDETKGIFDVYKNGKLIGRATDPVAEPDGSFSYGSMDLSGRFGRKKERIDNSSRMEFDDGSAYEQNEQGKFTRVEYPPKQTQTKGKTREFSYDAQGRLTAVKSPEGTFWRQNADNHWVEYKDASATEATGSTYDGMISIDGKSGVFERTDSKSAQTVREFVDGSRLTVDKDGSSIEEKNDGSKVSRNREAQITAIEYPAQQPRQKNYVSALFEDIGLKPVLKAQLTARQFEYDKDSIVRVKNSDGTIWQIEPSTDIWAEYKTESGKTIATGKKWQGEVFVNNETGEYSYTENGQKSATTEQTDGTKTWWHDKGDQKGRRVIDRPDHSRIEYNDDNQVTSTTDSRGLKRTFKYDTQDKTKLVEVTTGETKWTTNPDNPRQFLDEYGKKINSVTVDADGNLTYKKDGREIVERLDGRKVTRTRDAGEIVQSPDGKIVQSTDALGRTHKFEYGPDGKLARVANPDGTVFSVTGETETGKPIWSGKNAATNKDETWIGNVEVKADAFIFDDGKTRVTEQLNGNRLTKDIDPESKTYGRITKENKEGKVDEIEPAVDFDRMSKDAEAIWTATKGGTTGIGYDKKTIDDILKNASMAEKESIDRYLSDRYGWKLETLIRDEMAGAKVTVSLDGLGVSEEMTADLAETLGYLHQMDKDDSSSEEYDRSADAARMQKDMLEIQQKFFGRSANDIEKEMRETVAKLNSQEIAAFEKEYARLTGGDDFFDSIASNPDVSLETKQAMEIYRKGADERTDGDSLRLAEAAMQARSMTMFEEAMRSGSPQARKQFMEQGGEQKLLQAFGEQSISVFTGTTSWEPTDNFRVAKDYARFGKLSADTAVTLSTSWMGDSEVAIENAFHDMSADERQRYMTGRALVTGHTLPEGFGKDLTPEQLEQAKSEAVEYFERLSASMKGAASDYEFAKWEDMIAVKDGGIIKQVLAHEGIIYDDAVKDAIADIENMTPEQWQVAKENQQQYKDMLDSALSRIYNDNEKSRILAAFDAKLSAQSFAEARESGNRDVLAKLTDAAAGISSDSKEALAAVAAMTQAEQENFINDNPKGYKYEVQRMAYEAIGDKAIADRLFAFIDEGMQPPEIITTLNKYALDTTADEAKVLKSIEKAFVDSELKGEHPSLRERINNPQTEEDRILASTFKESAKAAMGKWDYEDFVQPLVETGNIDTAVAIELFSDEGADKLEAAAFISGNERDAYLSALSSKGAGSQELEIAQHILEQGETRPEDKMRAYVTETAYSKDEIKDMLKTMSSTEKERMLNEYARKYGGALTADLTSALSETDATEILPAVTPEDKTASEAFHDRLAAYMKSRDEEIGNSLVDQFWDGTGHQLDASINQFASEMEESASQFETLSLPRQQELTENFDRARDAFIESKGATADAFVDATMALAGIAGAAATGGVSLALIAKVGGIGAALKVTTRAAVMGEDYDWSKSSFDAAAGFFDAAANFIGPGQVASALALGEKAGVRAAEIAVKKLGADAVETAGSELLKEGGEKLLEKEAQKAIQDAIVSGAKEIDEKTIAAMAAQVARDGAEKEVQAAIKAGFNQALKEEARTAIGRYATEYALDGGANAIGGFGSGMIQGLQDWDSTKSVSANTEKLLHKAATAAVFGVAGGLAFSTAFKTIAVGSKGMAQGIGWAYDGIKALRGAEDAGRQLEKSQSVAAEALSNKAVDKAIASHQGNILDPFGAPPAVEAGGKKFGSPDTDISPRAENLDDDVFTGSSDGNTKSARQHQVIGIDSKGNEIIDDPAMNHPGISFVDIDTFATDYGEEQIGGKSYYRKKQPDGELGGAYFQPVDTRVLPDARQQKAAVISLKDPNKLVLEEVQPPSGSLSSSPLAKAGFDEPTVSITDANSSPLLQDAATGGFFKKIADFFSGNTAPEQESKALHSASQNEDLDIETDSPPLDSGRERAQQNSGAPEIIKRVAGTELANGDVLIIGSGKSKDIRIEVNDTTVDHAHVKVRKDAAGNVFIEDLDSVNGTIIEHADGTTTRLEPSTELQLKPGDLILMGDANALSVFSEPVRLEQQPERISAPVLQPAPTAPPAQSDPFVNESTAPKYSVLAIENIAIGENTFQLGRGTANEGLNAALEGSSDVSRLHATISVEDGRIFITDTSSQGTFVTRGSQSFQLPPHQRFEWQPGDRLRLSTKEVSMETSSRPSYLVQVGDRRLNLGQGEVPVSDGRFGVLPDDAKLVQRADGIYLIVNNDSPVSVNGRRLNAAEEVRLNLKDVVAIGTPERSVADRRQGEWLHLFPTELQTVTPPASLAPVRQSNQFATAQEISEPLLDGFAAAGKKVTFNESTGRLDDEFAAMFDRAPNRRRHLLTVDREQDAVLSAVILQAKERFGGRDSNGSFKRLDVQDPTYRSQAISTAAQLTDYVHGLLNTQGWSGNQLDDFINGKNGFSRQSYKDRVLLGEYIKQGKGVCLQQAILMKVLCDELGIQADLVRGAGLRSSPNAINHAWVELRFPGEQSTYVFDPRNNHVKGKPYGDQLIGFHKRGSEVLAALDQAAQAPALPKEPANISFNNRQIPVRERQTIHIGRYDVGAVPEVSRNHLDIKRERGVLWLKDRSANGTFVNGVKVAPNTWMQIGQGDSIHLGARNGPQLDLTAIPPAEETQPMIVLDEDADTTER